MKSEEQEIIRLLKLGDNSAYKYIYDHHYSLLCATAFEYLKDDFLAQTTVDDLIVHLWEKRESLEITTSLRSYLVRSVRNRCINYLQLEREQKEVTFSSMEPHEYESILNSEALDHHLALLLEKVLDGKIMADIVHLPIESRRIFKMSRFEGKRYEDIAHELAISVNTVKYHIKNALAHLNDELSDYL
ncbi:MAG: RNA polymerase sigma-70 factor [Tannerella sp.]|jgi:RNA polymerase sigma-70 factor (ECF subfamily)|nr:RNA polymerase sigma-70 factor [Tannerella sp.]